MMPSNVPSKLTITVSSFGPPAESSDLRSVYPQTDSLSLGQRDGEGHVVEPALEGATVWRRQRYVVLPWPRHRQRRPDQLRSHREWKRGKL